MPTVVYIWLYTGILFRRGIRCRDESVWFPNISYSQQCTILCTPLCTPTATWRFNILNYHLMMRAVLCCTHRMHKMSVTKYIYVNFKCTHVNMLTYMYIYIYVNTKCTHSQAHTITHIYTLTHTRMHIRACIYMYIQTQTQTHNTHKLIRTQSSLSNCRFVRCKLIAFSVKFLLILPRLWFME